MSKQKYSRNETLIKERKKRGLKQRHLAAIVGTTRQYISQMERGERKPGPNMSIKLADFFGINPQDLR
jgi:transcriptional regulator with XRE-family HTH domain